MSKEIIMGWCKQGRHEECRVGYGGDTIVCICDCENHGIKHAKQREQIKKDIAEIEARLNKKSADGYRSSREDYTRTGNLNYKPKPNYDADTIEELERRRRKP